MKLTASSLVAAGLLAGAALHVAPATAGSLDTRTLEGDGWNIIDNPAEGQEDFLLRRTDNHRRLVPTFGRNGTSEFSLGPDNDAPASLRVEQSGRAWAVGTGTSGGRPQPVVVRFLPNGDLDTRWGVQGRVQINPNGVAVRANDMLPLADGSVLVAGEAPALTGARAVVFRLKPDGTVDPAFGAGGLWQRPGRESAVAASLAYGSDGGIAVGVSVRGDKPTGEIWSLWETPSQLLARDELDDGIDEDDIHIEMTAGHQWRWVMAAGVRGLVPPLTLAKPVGSAASAPSDPGQGAFSPFTEHAAPAASAAGAAPDEDGTPWGWIGAIVVVALGLLGFVLTRGGRAAAAPSRR